MSINRFGSVCATMAGVLLLASCHAAPHASPVKWKSECVGRYQLDLPSDVEVALATLPGVMRLEHSDITRFADGSVGRFAFIGYSKGSIRISEALSKKAFAELQREYDEKIKKEIEEEVVQITTQPERIQVRLPEMFSDARLGTVDNEPYFRSRDYLYRGGRVISLSSEGDRLTTESIPKHFVKAYQPRALFELPAASGTCFPYGFLPDEGKEHRRITVAMRLKDHPDVQVIFTDTAAEGNDRNEKDELTMFWTMQFGNRTERLESLHGAIDFPAVTIAGRKGRSSLVEMDWNDEQGGGNDFGYAAYVKGDPKASVDTPDLWLYVLRKAADANGKKPVTQKELEVMAETIAASIKRR